MIDIDVSISSTQFDIDALTATLRRYECGGVVVFEGNVRSPNQGHNVTFLDYEAYDRAAVPQMRLIAQEVSQTHGLHAVVVSHRTGRLEPGETAFFVGVAAPHRQAAFSGASQIVDRVKAEVAIWKTEFHTSKP